MLIDYSQKKKHSNHKFASKMMQTIFMRMLNGKLIGVLKLVNSLMRPFIGRSLICPEYQRSIECVPQSKMMVELVSLATSLHRIHRHPEPETNSTWNNNEGVSKHTLFLHKSGSDKLNALDGSVHTFHNHDDEMFSSDGHTHIWTEHCINGFDGSDVSNLTWRHSRAEPTWIYVRSTFRNALG